MRRIISALLLFSSAIWMSACTGGRAAGLSYAVSTGGDVERGHQVILDKGCGSCHTIPGIRSANGLVGPPLLSFARRTYIAGELPNTTDNLMRWVKAPQAVEPNTAMPNLGLSDQDARDVAAYLYTLR